jgi:hypothetical protein
MRGKEKADKEDAATMATAAEESAAAIASTQEMIKEKGKSRTER